ncbi:MAG: peptidyl-prolyl cis-trans isomerase [Gemmatimonadetes bacterium]|nr:peptidyl-prolyl cis-trans isomerase [Gemmatimonadota bacterium]
MNRALLILALALSSVVGACGAFGDALTGHAGPAATAAGHTLHWEDLGQLMAESSIPDSALTPYWAGQLVRLWADFMVLATLYQDPDTTRSVDYTRLMEDGRYLAQLAVMRYRDSVVLAGIEPSEEELHEYFEVRQPYTRLDVRRVVFTVPDGTGDSVRDSLFAEARAIRERLVGGAGFVSVAREKSTEPVQARGQVLAYQGHPGFPSTADSVVFTLQPGELSPVIATEDEFVIYRIEARREPDFEQARDLVYQLVLDERREQRTQEAMETMVGDSRRTVMQSATDLATQIALDPVLAANRIPDGIRLVTWDGGDLSAGELRRLFLVREDMRELFAEASVDQVHDYLMQLAADEILIVAATASGIGASVEEREQIAGVLADQLGRIASRGGLSHRLVIDPKVDLDVLALGFFVGVLERSNPVPWLGSFRVVLDPRFPVRVDDNGASNAARRATELRATGTDTGGSDTEAQHGVSEDTVEIE